MIKFILALLFYFVLDPKYWEKKVDLILDLYSMRYSNSILQKIYF